MRNGLIVGGIAWLVAAFILVGRPARAMADATAPDFDPATSFTMHLQLPLLGYSSHTAAPSGLVSSPYGGFGIVHWGGSIGARFFRLLRLLASVGGGEGEESGMFGNSVAWVDIGRITEVGFTIGLAFR